MTRIKQRLLMLIDKDPGQQRLVAAVAARAGWRTIVVSGGEEAMQSLKGQDGRHIAAILLDQDAASEKATAVITALREQRPLLPILLLTGDDSVENAVAAMRNGATDYLVKPIGRERMTAALNAAIDDTGTGELRPLTEKIPALLAFDEIVGSAPDFRAALAVAAKAARARVAILVQGESGVGKEVVAEAIHAASPRSQRQLATIDCGAMPQNLVASELFGHESGAFPGAFERRVGRIVTVDGGTVFLDEVGGLNADVQSRLLQLLDHGQVHPIGAQYPVNVDVRIIASTNCRLAEEVEAGRFREDLYQRLNAVNVVIPPLRERRGDIAALARHLLTRIGQQPGLRALGITDDALALLSAYDWPGNVRQLQNALFRAAVLCEGDALTANDFPQLSRIGQRREVPVGSIAGGGVTLFADDGHLRPLDDIEADIIRLAIGHYRGRMAEVARRLGIGRSTLYRKLGDLGIDNAA